MSGCEGSIPLVYATFLAVGSFGMGALFSLVMLLQAASHLPKREKKQ